MKSLARRLVRFLRSKLPDPPPEDVREAILRAHPRCC